MLGNLLDNAWRYCSRLPGAIRLLAHALDQHHAELIVWNDGIEIPREHQRSLFEPFFTSNAQGTGLGLFMARELCGANDAQVRYRHHCRSMTCSRAPAWWRPRAIHCPPRPSC
ncbi:sensor histidine kinase [Cupriavidus basilensis]